MNVSSAIVKMDLGGLNCLILFMLLFKCWEVGLRVMSLQWVEVQVLLLYSCRCIVTLFHLSKASATPICNFLLSLAQFIFPLCIVLWLKKKPLQKTRVIKRLQMIQAMSQTPDPMRELDETSSATHQQEEAGQIEPEVAYVGHSTNIVAGNSAAQFNSPQLLATDSTVANIAQAVRTDISSAPSDWFMLYRQLLENSRSSKRKRALAATEQEPVSVREIGETSAQGTKQTQAKNNKKNTAASKKKGVKQATVKKPNH
ncbi:uncharacterized protein LOC110692999 isoform X10 [Chenopodium quinoa]|uniref:uncharacterized protein LOC110692999 isoform X10 n=1 Tax=Chenopodium quinoa TaxID=63459 RepID=UPI000B783805|nr:uncharacterized protein LOC110692999 isoform X10 [Chenopodium quinoa]